MLKIALPKGRLLKHSIKLFKKMGFDLSRMLEEDRKLLFEFPQYEIETMVVKPMDVPTYVEHGVADVGIAGKDVILESGAEVYEPLDLKFGYCRMVVAQPRDAKLPPYGIGIKVATKYPRIAERHFGKKGIPVEIVHLYGSVELAPITGLAHQIVDLVETGTTLRENNLVEIETILEVTARLIVNRSSMRVKHRKVKDFIDLASQNL